MSIRTDVSRFTWLHLSDWHQKGDEWDRGVVLGALLKDLKGRQGISPDLARIDAVFFTGDLAYSGKRAEFDRAFERFLLPVLEAVEIPKERLFIIPGNHDLDRSRFNRLPAGLQKPFASNDASHDWFADEEGRDELQKPFRDYLAALRAQGVVHFGGLGHSAEFRPGGFRIGVVGVNSALMCGRRLIDGEVDDFGVLHVGEQQVVSLLEQIAECDVRIGLIHHPFEWLKWFDKDLVEQRMRAGLDLILSGHVHQANVQISEDSAGKVVVVPAGAAYDRREANQRRYANAYNFGTVDLATGKGCIHLRCWGANNTDWETDRRAARNGKKTFTVPGLARSGPKPKTSKPGKEDELAEARTAYLQWVRRRYSTLDPVGIGEKSVNVSLPLDQVYVTLSAHRSESGDLVLDPHAYEREREEGRDAKRDRRESEEEEFRVVRRQPSVSLVTVDLPTVLRQSPKAVLLGDPGAGKTTTLRFLAARNAAALLDGAESGTDAEGTDFGPPRLPILVRIGDYAVRLRKEPALALGEFITSTFSECGANLGALQSLLKSVCNEGGALLLLDGLDEVVSDAERGLIAESIRNFAAGIGSASPILVSSRIQGYERAGIGGPFQTYTLRDLDREQIAKFLDRWCVAVERVRQPNATDSEQVAAAQIQIDALLQAVDENVGVQRLARNPLLLTTLAYIKREGGEMPRRRVELYQQSVKILLRQWRTTGRALPFDEVSENEQSQILGPLAYEIHANYDNGPIPEADLQTFLMQKLSEVRGIPLSNPALAAAVEDFLHRVRVHTGFFVERAPGRYGFMHLTFEEYFAGMELVRDPLTATEKIRGLSLEPRWEEPIRLAIAAQTPDFATQLIFEGVKRPFGADELESILHRRLFLAVRCYGDSQGVTAGRLNELIKEMLETSIRSELNPLKAEARKHLRAFVGTSAEQRLVSSLISGLKDQDWNVRYACASALGSLGVRDEEVVSSLISGLKDRNWRVRSAYASALGSLGVRDAEVVSSLISGLKDQDWDVRYACASALGSLGVRDAEVVSSLIEGLQDMDWNVRYPCASALGSLGVRDAEVVSSLISGLKDEDSDVRRACASALGSLGVRDLEVVSSLIEGLKDEDCDVRDACASALGSLRVRDAEVVSSLVSGLKDEDSDVGDAFASALGFLGVRDAEVVSSLIEGLHDELGKIRDAFASALGFLGVRDPEVVSALISGLKDEDSDVRYVCASALGSLGVRDAEVVSSLVSGLQDMDWNVRYACASALGSLGVRDAKVVSALIVALDHQFTGSAAWTALWRLHTAEARA